jgi:hypothetical protein
VTLQLLTAQTFCWFVCGTYIKQFLLCSGVSSFIYSAEIGPRPRNTAGRSSKLAAKPKRISGQREAPACGHDYQFGQVKHFLRDEIRSMTYDDEVARLKRLFTRSEKRLPLPDRGAAEAGAARLADGPYLNSLSDRLKALLLSKVPTTFDVSDVRKIANTLDLEQAMSPCRPTGGLRLPRSRVACPGSRYDRPRIEIGAR